MQYRIKVAFDHKAFSILLKAFSIAICLFFSNPVFSQNNNSVVQMVFTSDAHYGITRKHFRGDSNVNGHTVNAAMIGEINKMPDLIFPADGGIGAGKKV